MQRHKPWRATCAIPAGVNAVTVLATGAGGGGGGGGGVVSATLTGVGGATLNLFVGGGGAGSSTGGGGGSSNVSVGGGMQVIAGGGGGGGFGAGYGSDRGSDGNGGRTDYYAGAGGSYGVTGYGVNGGQPGGSGYGGGGGAGCGPSGITGGGGAGGNGSGAGGGGAGGDQFTSGAFGGGGGAGGGYGGGGGGGSGGGGGGGGGSLGGSFSVAANGGSAGSGGGSGSIVITWADAPAPTALAAPTASDVTINGTPLIGSTLTGSYTYASANGAVQGNSTYRWLAGTAAVGGDKRVIDGATSTSYVPVAADGGNYLFFCVVPVAQTGILTGSEVCSSGVQLPLVSNITSPTAVTGIGPNQIAPLDLTTGYGPSLTNCLMTTIRQLLGQDAQYLGQVSGGAARVLQGGKVISFYVLRAGGDTNQSQGLGLLANNALTMGTSCGHMDMVPALYNPAEFGAALTALGLSATIDASGVITVTGGGGMYAARPDYFVTPGQTAGAGLQMGSDGQYRFTDSAGNSQVLHAAFLSPAALQAGAGSALGGTLTIQTDGTALFTQFNGRQSVLNPDLVLGPLPAAFAQSSWWTDGTNHFRYPIGFA